MAEEWEKYAILKSQFRRRSSTEFTGAGFSQVVHTTEVPKLLDELGEHKVDSKAITTSVSQLDPNHTGRLNFEQYSQLASEHVKDPSHNSIAMEFKTLCDFETP